MLKFLRSNAVLLVLVLVTGCAAPVPVPAPAHPPLPVPMPDDPYGLDFPPVPVWDFYREWLGNPAAAHYKYRGRTVTLVYVRGLVPHPKDGVFLAALQAPKGEWNAKDLQRQIERGTKSGIDSDALEAGWGPWLASFHRPTAGRDFQLRCKDDAGHLWGPVSSFFVLEKGEDRPGPFVEKILEAPSEVRAIWREVDPLAKSHPMLRLQAEAWNDRVYVVHARVIGHVVGNVPYGGHNYSRHSSMQDRYLHVELDHCAFEFMDITSAELDAWFDADRERLAAPRSAPYRPITRSDRVVPLAEPLNSEVEDRIKYDHGYFGMANIVGRIEGHFVVQAGVDKFQLVPMTDFTAPRSDAPSLPMVDIYGSEGWWDALDTVDRLRRNWLYAQDGPCVFQDRGWPECVLAAKAAWLSDAENREAWDRLTGK